MADIMEYLYTLAVNFQRNLSETLSTTTTEKYIRLIVIVGAYALLRPYIMKIGARVQGREHEKEVDPDEMAAAAAISPNSLRGQVQVPDDSSDEGEGTAGDWGKKARRRQRQMVKKILDAKEELRREQQEDDEDKDIQEFLAD
jgi:hypothetical protein